VVSLKRFFVGYSLVVLAASSLVVLLAEQSRSSQIYLEVDLADLTVSVEDFRDKKIRTKGTVEFRFSFYMCEDFWLTQGSYGIPVVVRDAGLSVPSENSSIVIWGTVKYSGIEGGFFYLDATSWDYAEDMVSGTGTIRFFDFEGGFYGIVSDDGEHYDPINLNRGFQVDGLRVHFEIRILRDVHSYHMWGEVVSILHIGKLD
jgi:hypothetical protein